MSRRESNLRPLRGITADTVRALLNLRHAGSDCAYLPIERTRLVDEVKGRPAPRGFDRRDAPATIREDCNAMPPIAGKRGFVIVDEHFEIVSPPGQEPAAKDDMMGAASPALRVIEAAPNPTPYVTHPAPSPDSSDGARSAGPTEPTAPKITTEPTAPIVDSVSLEPELKQDRAALIREIGVKLAKANKPAPRPVVGPRIERKAMASSTTDPIVQRREALERAIRFLKSRCILVDITDRSAAIRQYRVSGKRHTMLAEQVIEHAVALGMEAHG